MKRNNIYLVFNHFDEQHLGKDVFLTPYYLGKVKQHSVTIVFPATSLNKNMPKFLRGVKLIRLKYCNKKLLEIRLTLFTLIKTKSIGVLMLFHFTIHTVIKGILYKIFNHNGTLYIKADISLTDLCQFNKLFNRNNLKTKIKKIFWKFFLQKIDCLSVESQQCFKYLQNNKLINIDLSKKLKYIPNGFDEELLDTFNIREKSIEEKENIFLVVGRLGSYPKNTEVLLEAVKKINFKNWKIYFIGPLEQDFEKLINSFFYEYPQLKENIMFLGAIFDKKILFEYFNKSKVFLLPSRWEGFAIVLNEAARFTNYIVATDVGGVKDTLKMMNNYGTIIEQDDQTKLAEIMQNIIDEKINLTRRFKNVDREKIKIENAWLEIIKNAKI